FAVDGMILENLLESEQGAENNRLRQALYADFRMRNPQLKRGTKEWNEAWAADKYVNALRVRYGYAVTCHKAQGGEWENVFVDCAWKAPRHSSSYFRWLYTAVTRATSRLYLASAEDLRF
ncbi:MAG: ATP-binding domain-containing protein, partial [Sutterella sp.]|nr:ATP-binding domain-containing protein [Sutterella sp.]